MPESQAEMSSRTSFSRPNANRTPRGAPDSRPPSRAGSSTEGRPDTPRYRIFGTGPTGQTSSSPAVCLAGPAAYMQTEG